MFISFSGIDGAGKSTQIHCLSGQLRDMRLRVLRITFWTDIAALTRFRDRMSHRVFRGERGIGQPERPVRRRDKNVRAWYLTILRCFFYLLDAMNLRRVFSQVEDSRMDVVIFDRYIYDELANLPLANASIRWFARLLLKLSPRPDLPLVLTADPVEARVRKPEYPEDFLRRNQAAFLDLAQLAELRVIEPFSVDEMANRIADELARMLSHNAEEAVRQRWLRQGGIP